MLLTICSSEWQITPNQAIFPLQPSALKCKDEKGNEGLQTIRGFNCEGRETILFFLLGDSTEAFIYNQSGINANYEC